MDQSPSRAASPILNLSTETLNEKERASHSPSELCAALCSNCGDFGLGYTDEVANVDADDATKLGYFYVGKACSTSPDKTKLPEEN